MNSISRHILGLLLAAASLSGCGQKGPLTLPNAPANAPWPYVPPAESAPKESQPAAAREQQPNEQKK